MAGLDLLDNGAVLCCLGLVDNIGVVDTGDGAVRRNFNDVEVVDRAEFLFLRERRTRNADRWEHISAAM